MPSRVPGSFQQIPMPGGAPPLIESFPEAAAQVFVAGDLVTRSAGKIALAGANPALILGIARQNSNGVTGHRVLVEIIRPGFMYEGNLRVATDTFVEGTDNDISYDIARTAAGNWEIAKTTAATRVVVLDTLEKSVDGIVTASLGGPVKFFFKGTNLEATV